MDDPAASTERSLDRPSDPDRPLDPSEPPPRVAAAVPGRERAADLVLASVHLRLGAFALARAELETLAGRDELDAKGIVDLAEVRWRTGDVEGAGEAAALALDDEEGPLVALIVAAEAAAARGRPTEARRLAAKALAAANGSIDRVFAGMPRSPAWPPDPAAPPPAPTTMFDPPHGPGVVTRQARPRPARTQAARSAPPRPAASPPGPMSVAAPAQSDAPGPTDAATIGLWGDDAEAQARQAGVLPSATDALERGRISLESGDAAEASVQLALVLRLSSALAPAVLDLVADRTEPDLAFVRGDAYRLVGREQDARRAYALAAGRAPSADASTVPGQSPPSSPHEGEPA